MMFRLADLAAHVGAEVAGQPDRRIVAVRSLDAAGPEDLSFLVNIKHRRRAENSGAGGIVAPPEARDLPQDLLICADPEVAMVDLLELFHPSPSPESGVHSTAIVDDSAVIADSAYVGPFAVVEAGSVIGADSIVHAHVHLGSRVRLGERVVLHPHVTIYADTEIGDDVAVHSGSVLGADGHGYIQRDGRYRKIPQVGRLVVESDVEIGANSAVDRATLERTRIGRGTKIDNLVQIGHNVDLGEDGMVCSGVGIAGSTTIGHSVVMAGHSGFSDHLQIGDRVTVGAQSAVLQDLGSDQMVGGTPAIDYSKWRRQWVMVGRLEEMNRRLRAVEKKLLDLEGSEH